MSRDRSRRARVVAAALRTWATLRRTTTPPAVRVDVRQPERWSHVATIDLDDAGADRVLALLREDVARTPATLADHVDGWLTEQAAAGRTRVRARDLLDVAVRAGRTKSELAAHLAGLVDAGRLRETRRPGVFRLIPRPAWAVRPGLPAARNH